MRLKLKKSGLGFVFTVFECALLLLILTGCAKTNIRTLKPSFELPAEFSAQGAGQMPDKWWQSLNDPGLDALIEQSLRDNFTIRSAWDRLTQAEQTVIKANASSFPEVTYQGSAKRTRQETSGNKTYTSNYTAGLIASYEVDLWGRIKSSQQAAVLDAQAAQQNVNSAAMTLTAVIAKTWYQLAEAKLQEDIIRRQIETNNKILEVIKLQFRQAQVGAADVFSQEQLVQSSMGQLIQVQENMTLIQNQLSILTGKIPGQWWSDQKMEMITLGQLPTIDVPAVVIQRRPDVISAYKAVQAADQRVAYAIADQYPSLSLSSTIETSAARVRDLFDDWFVNLAANLTGPIIDAGYRKAEAERARAVLSEKMNDYSQVVLKALQEAEDAMSQEYYQRQYVENLQKQLSLARNVYNQTYQNYLKGKLDYLRVLAALVSMQSLEQNELIARRLLIERRIDVCRSIAGGWQLPRPESAQMTTE